MYVGFQVVTEVAMKSSIFRDIMPCSQHHLATGLLSRIQELTGSKLRLDTDGLEVHLGYQQVV
jgi:hypothetical protein